MASGRRKTFCPLFTKKVTTYDLLRAELKALQEDRHRVTLELRQRQANVERLKSRFEATNSDNNDEKHSQAYYVIKAAQKKEELQRRGDQLDQDIRKCEREIRALQTTLDHLNARNVAFRESFQKIDIKGDDAEILKQLEERIKLTKDQLFRKKKDLQRLVTDFDEDARRLEQVNTQADKVMKQKEHLTNAKKQVEDELYVQQVQLDELAERIEKTIEKHHRRFQDNGGDLNKFPNGTLEEKAVRAEVIKDVVQVSYFTPIFKIVH
jgi:chromosome segregation ATPase